MVGESHPGPKVKAFDSEKEYERFQFLRGELAAGRLQSLRTQVVFWLHSGNGVKITKYIADFVYVIGGVRFVEDVKSPRTVKTRAFQIKRKWLRAEHGIELVIT